MIVCVSDVREMGTLGYVEQHLMVKWCMWWRHEKGWFCCCCCCALLCPLERQRRASCVGDVRAWCDRFKSNRCDWVANSEVPKRRMRQPIKRKERQQWKNAEFDGWGRKRSSQKQIIEPIRNWEIQPRNSLTFCWELALSIIYCHGVMRSFVNNMRCVTHKNTVCRDMELLWHSTTMTQTAQPFCVTDTDRSPNKHRPDADLCRFIL